MSDIQQEHFECNSSDVNKNYEKFAQKLLKIVNNHVPSKSKNVRGDNVFFMNKNWRKAIYEKTHQKNIYNKNRSRDYWNNHKKQRNFCTNLRKKSIKGYFRNVSEGKLFSSNRDFWKVIKLFLTNKGFFANSDIFLNKGN